MSIYIRNQTSYPPHSGQPIVYEFPSEDGYSMTPPPFVDGAGDTVITGGIEALKTTNKYSITGNKKPFAYGSVITGDGYLDGRSLSLGGIIRADNYKNVDGSVLYDKSVYLHSIVAEMEHNIKTSIANGRRLFLSQYALYGGESKYSWYYDLTGASLESFDVEFYQGGRVADIDFTILLADPTLYNYTVQSVILNNLASGTISSVSESESDSKFDLIANIESPPIIVVEMANCDGWVSRFRMSNDRDGRAFAWEAPSGGSWLNCTRKVTIDCRNGTVVGTQSIISGSGDWGPADNHIKYFYGQFFNLYPRINHINTTFTAGSGSGTALLKATFYWHKRRTI